MKKIVKKIINSLDFELTRHYKKEFDIVFFKEKTYKEINTDSKSING